MRTTLIAIRHGETESNLVARFQGQLDVPLNDRGRQQAIAVAQALADLQPAALFSSDLSRAHETALSIARACNVEVVVDARLRERAFGRFEGLTKPEVAAKYPQDYARLEARERHFKPLGGESIHELHERVATVMRDLAERHAGSVIVLVTHLWVLDSLYRCARKIALETESSWRVPNAASCCLTYDQGEFEVQEWGSVSHLLQVSQCPVQEADKC